MLLNRNIFIFLGQFSMLFNGNFEIFIFCQFSMLFNGNFEIFILCQFSMLFNGNFTFFYYFFQISMLCNCALKPNLPEVPPCSTGHRPLRGRCPANDQLHSPTYKAGQRVSLTTHCPWATFFRIMH